MLWIVNVLKRIRIILMCCVGTFPQKISNFFDFIKSIFKRHSSLNLDTGKEASSRHQNSNSKIISYWVSCVCMCTTTYNNTYNIITDCPIAFLHRVEKTIECLWYVFEKFDQKERTRKYYIILCTAILNMLLNFNSNINKHPASNIMNSIK